MGLPSLYGIRAHGVQISIRGQHGSNVFTSPQAQGQALRGRLTQIWDDRVESPFNRKLSVSVSLTL